jgi:NAD(P)-dependent dehydrogenase (short-subunit alcohol dehydrogenase family)
MELGLKGRTVLITGGSKGIGRSVAEFLAAEGCHLHLVSRSKEDLETARDEITKKHGVKVTVHAINLAERGKPKALFEACRDIDVLINNAGSIPRGSVEEIGEDRWRDAWDLKVFGYINLCREYFAMMKARRRGVIINIIGNGGEKLDSGYIAGGTGNAALMAFTRALGGSSGDFNVRVVGLNPGPVATERLVGLMQKEAVTRFNDASRWREFEKSFPFGRAATVEEISPMVVLLASDLSAYTTGTIVTIDGGMANRSNLI